VPAALPRRTRVPLAGHALVDRGLCGPGPPHGGAGAPPWKAEGFARRWLRLAWMVECLGPWPVTRVAVGRDWMAYMPSRRFPLGGMVGCGVCALRR